MKVKHPFIYPTVHSRSTLQSFSGWVQKAKHIDRYLHFPADHPFGLDGDEAMPCQCDDSFDDDAVDEVGIDDV